MTVKKKKSTLIQIYFPSPVNYSSYLPLHTHFLSLFTILQSLWLSFRPLDMLALLHFFLYLQHSPPKLATWLSPYCLAGILLGGITSLSERDSPSCMPQSATLHPMLRLIFCVALIIIQNNLFTRLLFISQQQSISSIKIGTLPVLFTQYLEAVSKRRVEE